MPIRISQLVNYNHLVLSVCVDIQPKASSAFIEDHLLLVIECFPFGLVRLLKRGNICL